MKTGESFDQMSYYQLFKKASAPWRKLVDFIKIYRILNKMHSVRICEHTAGMTDTAHCPLRLACLIVSTWCIEAGLSFEVQ
jgi:hypothetical protein